MPKQGGRRGTNRVQQVQTGCCVGALDGEQAVNELGQSSVTVQCNKSPGVAGFAATLGVGWLLVPILGLEDWWARPSRMSNPAFSTVCHIGTKWAYKKQRHLRPLSCCNRAVYVSIWRGGGELGMNSPSHCRLRPQDILFQAALRGSRMMWN